MGRHGVLRNRGHRHQEEARGASHCEAVQLRHLRQRL